MTPNVDLEIGGKGRGGCPRQPGGGGALIMILRAYAQCAISTSARAVTLAGAPMPNLSPASHLHPSSPPISIRLSRFAPLRRNPRAASISIDTGICCTLRSISPAGRSRSPLLLSAHAFLYVRARA